MSRVFFSVAERPELRERRRELGDVWAQFLLHDAVSNRFWSRLHEEFPACQLFLVDSERDTLLAEGTACPRPGTLQTFPTRVGTRRSKTASPAARRPPSRRSR